MTVDNNTISHVERIAILTKLIIQSIKTPTILSIKMAKDLAYVIDELRKNKISQENLESVFLSVFPQHWQDRFKFVKIVSHYWCDILKDLGMEDIKLAYKPITNTQIQDNSDIIHTLKNTTNKIFLGCFEDSMDEMDYIAHLCETNKNLGNRISVVSPCNDFTEQLYNRISFCENLSISVNFYKMSRDIIDRFIISKKTDDQRLNSLLQEIDKHFSKYLNMDISKYIDKILIILIDYIDKEQEENNASDVSIITPSAIQNSSINRALILSMMTEEYWRPSIYGSYWLHDSMRRKLNLQTYDDKHKELVNYFYSSFLCVRQGIYLLHSRKHLQTIHHKSAILDKFETICAKHKIHLEKANQDIVGQLYCATNRIETDTIDDTKHCIPDTLYDEDVRLLLQNPEAFYAKCELQLTDRSQEEKHFSFLYDKLLHDYFCGCTDDIIEMNLRNIMDHDIFRYHQCVELIRKLKESRDERYVRNSIVRRGHLCINLANGYSVKIKSKCSKIYKNEFFFFCHDRSMIDKHDLTSRYGAILLKCLIKNYSGAGDLEPKQVDQAFIIDLNSHKDIGYTMNINQKDCQEFLALTTCAIENYCKFGYKKIYDNYGEMIKFGGRRYKHFIRADNGRKQIN